MRAGLIRCLLLVCLAAGGWQLGQVAYFHAKAFLADYLIALAWQETLKNGQAVRPWHWADTWPVAELSVPSLAIRQIILSGDSGRMLAFAPGHTQQSALPGKGMTLISGHRDTHFAFLKDLRAGDKMMLQTPTRTVHYQIEEFAVVDERDYTIDSTHFGHQQQGAHSSLLLVTCYPFNALLAGGHQRYLVLAVSYRSEII